MVTLNLFGENINDINKFLSSFYNTKIKLKNTLSWKKIYYNPIELAEIIGVYIDNDEFFSFNMWISLDKSIYIQILNKNGNDIIKYLFERYPY